ncbi:MAG TPA: primosome assembly protein PriA, partial [Marmoricola sp.]|nr:primosome assembly protein PriA [Marmoricola sp.]
MSGAEDQLALPGLIEARAAARSARKQAASHSKKPTEWAPSRPIAQVLVDVSLAHLDRPFDYRVPADLDELAQPGVRVKVRFAGRQVAGFVVARSDHSDQQRLQPLLKVVSGEPVLTPEIAELSAAIAGRYAGTRADVLRLAVPARHARVEQEPAVAPTQPFTWGSTAQEWVHYAGFKSLLTGQSRVVMSLAPGDDWTTAFCAAAGATLARGEGVVMCVPDHLDVKRLDEAMRRRWGDHHHVVLTADLGPAARYRAFLALSRGQIQIVIGTRAAAFA